ncbi:hypothetical protein [Haloarchaeobius sp. TZWSO28]|uniref:hypothetical protein n=1 Tax=unclassified Haloarchaeobius TaxID=2614452 RepID=UPI003EBAABBB
MKRNFIEGTSRRTVLKTVGIGLVSLGLGSGIAAAADRSGPSQPTVQSGELPTQASHRRRYRRYGRRRYRRYGRRYYRHGRRRYRRYRRHGYGWAGYYPGYYGDDVEITVYGDPYYSGYYGGYGPVFVDDDEYVYFGPGGYVEVDFD